MEKGRGGCLFGWHQPRKNLAQRCCAGGRKVHGLSEDGHAQGAALVDVEGFPVFAVPLHRKGFNLAVSRFAGMDNDGFHHVFANQRDVGFVADRVVRRVKSVELREPVPIVVPEQIVSIFASLILKYVYDVVPDCVLSRVVAVDTEQNTECKGEYKKEDQTEINGAADEVDEFTHVIRLPMFLFASNGAIQSRIIAQTPQKVK
ncbi:hypothetical protein IKQ38_01065 [Candidatus Saccharibacteria bacterium]|nr:hypothetical protein [Candidatus Saccharibacteria bacterium]